MRYKLPVNKDTMLAAVIGGAFFDSGEGGRISYGKAIGELAIELGQPKIIDLEALPDHATLLEVCVLGAPSSKDNYLKPVYHIDAAKKFIQQSGKKIDALITSANGGYATINGWLQSVVLDIPVVDAVCAIRKNRAILQGPVWGNGYEDDFVSMQMGVGGNPLTDNYMEVFVQGSLQKTDSLIQQANVLSGGGLSLTRNPVSGAYAKKYAIRNALSTAIALGKIVLAQAGDVPSIIDSIVSYLGGEVITYSAISKFIISSSGGFDNGFILVGSGNKDNNYTINYHEHNISLEKNGTIIATFPDLILTLSMETGMPIHHSQLKEDNNVCVMVIRKEKLAERLGIREFFPSPQPADKIKTAKTRNRKQNG